ncbi:MAG: aminomethyl-transferring glycine dehydrogenase subunit GcvPA [Phycisphaerae bacterium]|nr:aminomethyl-transferring glycine dehydrogenase subunit GcvPA [Phycisphaerae bacterium]
MRYTQLTETDVAAMLDRIGVSSIESLLSRIDPADRLKGELELPAAVSELELLAELDRLGKRNRSCDEQVCFLGAGAYDHFIPTVVDALANQSEFVTAYTPYQAEASQGALQAFYEFQTMICQLTGMDVSNASLYELGSATAEAVLMARSITGKRRVLVPETIQPDCRTVLATYTRELPIELVSVPMDRGRVDEARLRELLDKDTAAVLAQSPNFFGCVEQIDLMVEAAHGVGALAIVMVDPIACGVLRPPGAFGADIVVGEGQPLGIPLSLGGPYLGLMACRQEHMRKIPGRVVGATHDAAGRRAYCLTLQTREQHIRRERATSNVCTNQGLLALRAAIYLSVMGKQGVVRVAKQCLDRAHYAAVRIAELDGFELAFPGAPFFKEFAVRTTKDVSDVLAACRQRGILAGVPLGRWYDELSDCFLVAVTEKRARGEIDALVEALA